MPVIPVVKQEKVAPLRAVKGSATSEKWVAPKPEISPEDTAEHVFPLEGDFQEF
jgi:hypothetical protein